MNDSLVMILAKVRDELGRCCSYAHHDALTVYLSFLKYVIDNKLIPLNEASDCAILLDAQRMFDIAVLEEEKLLQFGYVVERHFELPQGSMNFFASLCCRSINGSNDSIDKVLLLLKEISFENEGKSVGIVLQQQLWKSATTFGRMLSDSVSSKSLSLIMKELMNISDGDVFADFTMGFGVSSMEATANVNCKITGYDINQEKIAVAKMMLTMAGNDSVSVCCEDTTKAEIQENSFDKIAITPPLGVKIKEDALDSVEKDLLEKYGLPVKITTLTVLMVLKALDTLKSHGKIVIAVAPNVLFSSTVVDKMFRELISKKHLSAVLQFPSLYYGTNLQTIVLVLEKKRANEEIVFVDCATNKYYPFITREQRNSIDITEEGLKKIDAIIREKQVILGVSNVVSVPEIERNDYLLALVKYVFVEEQREYISNQAIDERLNVLYEKLKNLLEQ